MIPFIVVLGGCASSGDQSPINLSPVGIPGADETAKRDAIANRVTQVAFDQPNSERAFVDTINAVGTIGAVGTVDGEPKSSSDRSALTPDHSIARLLGEADFMSAEGDERSAIPAPGINLLELEALAEATHPELQRAQARIAEARGIACQAGLPYNPVLQYQSEEIGNDDATGLHSVTLSQRFVTANKLAIAQQTQLQVVQQRLAEYEMARLRVLTRVRAAFAGALIAQERKKITESIADLARQSTETVKSLLDAEEVSRIAYLQARVESNRATMAARNAATQLSQAQRTLAASVGQDALSSDRVRAVLPDDLPGQPWQSLAEQVETVSPQIASAAAQLQRARWALRLACAQVTPDITGQVAVGYDAATDDTYATIGVSVPLPIRNRNQGNIRAAQAGIGSASANIDQTELALRQQLADAVGRYEIARESYLQLRREIAPDAQDAYELARTAFQSGEADFLQVLTAQRTWFNTQLDAINALESAKKADAEIQGLLTLSTD